MRKFKKNSGSGSKCRSGSGSGSRDSKTVDPDSNPGKHLCKITTNTNINMQISTSLLLIRSENQSVSFHVRRPKFRRVGTRLLTGLSEDARRVCRIWYGRQGDHRPVTKETDAPARISKLRESMSGREGADQLFQASSGQGAT